MAGGIKKAMPHIDIWFQKGAHAGWDYEILDEAIAAEKPPKSYVNTFKRGYLTGRVTNAIFDFQSWLKYMDDDQLERLGHSLQQLSKQHDAELSRPDAPYKLGKVPSAKA